MTGVISTEAIAGRIFSIRGQKVMLDRDLAALYGVATKALKQAVRRNAERFPEDFMFELTVQEFGHWRSQFVTSSADKMGLRHRPMAFTEQGVAMLSSVLNSERAIEVNIQIIRTFTQLRRMAGVHDTLRREIEALEKRYDAQFEAVFTALRRLLEPEDEPPRKIGFTAREKRQSFGGPAAAPPPAFTPAAKKRWERIPPKLQAMLLGNAWCRTCREAGEMQLLSAKIEKGQLVLHGTCAACGEPVARVVERD
ncbi:MAG: ORF6N domain-containing protein [Desulfobacteraceae bacterium]|nr:ORF6N domain-containing protein [Desulfobacteraceae bacterium]